MVIFISRKRLKQFVEEIVERIVKAPMATVLQEVKDMRAEQAAKLNAIHDAVLAIESGGGSGEQLQLLRDILRAVAGEPDEDPEAPPELIALRIRAEAQTERWRGLLAAVRAVADLHNPTIQPARKKGK